MWGELKGKRIWAIPKRRVGICLSGSFEYGEQKEVIH
ncbi:hypothetical protein SS1G_11777 [Sclerotinia sclerotiorum 1980 UF-70]|uniref:Uncharacterized protein n=1 Tax=Sclerotinia sclerotiorum (strain ATCC 18683 / 1980 / Ss-1) TaxID=665079 RepID=A7F3D1_SCLS1|nr:hypothetical protein SS1G_11777 [Sclerotinia sclerotiorum 1980 UF-70]EDN97252.1 hypothetical protein SS1G_11777 [Sclerotinia sclerotiorum 1980 UF-70]